MARAHPDSSYRQLLDVLRSGGVDPLDLDATRDHLLDLAATANGVSAAVLRAAAEAAESDSTALRGWRWEDGTVTCPVCTRAQLEADLDAADDDFLRHYDLVDDEAPAHERPKRAQLLTAYADALIDGDEAWPLSVDEQAQARCRACRRHLDRIDTLMSDGSDLALQLPATPAPTDNDINALIAPWRGYTLADIASRLDTELRPGNARKEAGRSITEDIFRAARVGDHIDIVDRVVRRRFERDGHLGVGVDRGWVVKTIRVNPDTSEPLEDVSLPVFHPTSLAEQDWDDSLEKAVTRRLLLVVWWQKDRHEPRTSARLAGTVSWTPAPSHDRRLVADWQRIRDKVATSDVADVGIRADDAAFTVKPHGSGGQKTSLPDGTLWGRNSFYLTKGFLSRVVEQHYAKLAP